MISLMSVPGQGPIAVDYRGRLILERVACLQIRLRRIDFSIGTGIALRRKFGVRAPRTLVDSVLGFGTLECMEVTLSPDLQAKLTRVARDRGTNAQALAREAIERLVDYDDWFLREVEKGLAQIERGETLEHEEVGKRLERRLTGKRSHP